MALLLGCVVVYLGLLELATRAVYPRMSEGKFRELTDYRTALQIQPAPAGRKSVLLIGNSLLLEGVERERLRQALAPMAEVTLFPIEGTSYLDWYYGMRRFFREGTRPEVVVLCINARQVLSDSTNGERFANSMMSLADLWRVKQAAGLDSMTTSNYFFANLSAWVGDRTYVRNGLLEKLVPGVKRLVGYFTQRDPNSMTATGAVVERSRRRLEDFQALTRQYGARFVWLVPPTLNSADPAPSIADATAADLSVIIPYAPASLSLADFADGFHLNSRGAEKFTERTIPLLQAALSRSAGGSSQ